MTHKITTIFHTSTHVNAPIHLIPEAAAVGDLALEERGQEGGLGGFGGAIRRM